MSNWTKTSAELPDEGKVMDTISPSGVARKLQRKEGLWHVPGEVLAVLYVPTFWREVSHVKDAAEELRQGLVDTLGQIDNATIHIDSEVMGSFDFDLARALLKRLEKTNA